MSQHHVEILAFCLIFHIFHGYLWALVTSQIWSWGIYARKLLSRAKCLFMSLSQQLYCVFLITQNLTCVSLAWNSYFVYPFTLPLIVHLHHIVWWHIESSIRASEPHHVFISKVLRAVTHDFTSARLLRGEFDFQLSISSIVALCPLLSLERTRSKHR